MEKILCELLAEDRSLLFRNDEFIALLEKKIPPNLRREFSVIKIALKLNVGSFFVVDKDDHIGKYRAIKILLEGGMSEEKINFVLKIFERALSVNEDSSKDLAEEVFRLKNRIAELETQIKTAPSIRDDEVAEEKPGKFIWDSDELFTFKN